MKWMICGWNVMSDDNKIRLSKLMTQKGICSRREADDYIARGMVYVNGILVNELGSKVDPNARISLDTQALEQQKSLITLILNKPVGYVSSQPEDGYEPAVRLIVEENFDGQRPPQLNRDFFQGLAVVGRLDIDSQGLLLFTQDGRVAKKIIGENSELEKEYLVRIDGRATEDQLKKLRFGLELDGKKLKPAKVKQLNPEQLQIVLTEGKKRQIRRMCEQVGLYISGLKRVRIGGLKLGSLPESKWRLLTKEEVDSI